MSLTQGRPYKVKCPGCKRKRVGPSYRTWGKKDNLFVCGWCLDPDAARKEAADSRAARKKFYKSPQGREGKRWEELWALHGPNWYKHIKPPETNPDVASDT